VPGCAEQVGQRLHRLAQIVGRVGEEFRLGDILPFGERAQLVLSLDQGGGLHLRVALRRRQPGIPVLQLPLARKGFARRALELDGNGAADQRE
jgi:hypothetical protein